MTNRHQHIDYDRKTMLGTAQKYCALILSISTLILTGCTSVDAGLSKSKADRIKLSGSVVKNRPSRAQNRNEMSAQTLLPNQCGLFLWTKSEPRDFVFFHQEGSQSARFFYNQREHALTLKSKPKHHSSQTALLDAALYQEYEFISPVRGNNISGDDTVFENLVVTGRFSQDQTGVGEAAHRFSMADDLKNGMRISRAIARLQSANGWQISLPLHGVYACQN